MDDFKIIKPKKPASKKGVKSFNSLLKIPLKLILAKGFVYLQPKCCVRYQAFNYIACSMSGATLPWNCKTLSDYVETVATVYKNYKSHYKDRCFPFQHLPLSYAFSKTPLTEIITDGFKSGAKTNFNFHDMNHYPMFFSNAYEFLAHHYMYLQTGFWLCPAHMSALGPRLSEDIFKNIKHIEENTKTPRKAFYHSDLYDHYASKPITEILKKIDPYIPIANYHSYIFFTDWIGVKNQISFVIAHKCLKEYYKEKKIGEQYGYSLYDIQNELVRINTESPDPSNPLTISDLLTKYPDISVPAFFKATTEKEMLDADLFDWNCTFINHPLNSTKEFRSKWLKTLQLHLQADTKSIHHKVLSDSVRRLQKDYNEANYTRNRYKYWKPGFIY